VRFLRLNDHFFSMIIVIIVLYTTRLTAKPFLQNHIVNDKHITLLHCLPLDMLLHVFVIIISFELVLQLLLLLLLFMLLYCH